VGIGGKSGAGIDGTGGTGGSAGAGPGATAAANGAPGTGGSGGIGSDARSTAIAVGADMGGKSQRNLLFSNGAREIQTHK
jgi:hypothetical protein